MCSCETRLCRWKLFGVIQSKLVQLHDYLLDWISQFCLQTEMIISNVCFTLCKEVNSVLIQYFISLLSELSLTFYFVCYLLVLIICRFSVSCCIASTICLALFNFTVDTKWPFGRIEYLEFLWFSSSSDSFWNWFRITRYRLCYICPVIKYS
jgi:hypothetical protein